MRRSAVRPSPIFLALLAVTVVGGVLAALSDAETTRDPLLIAGVFILVLGGWAVSLTLHEFGHAIVAFRGGDHEVAIKGYLNMDIRRYTDPVFSLVLPLIILAIGGIPLPGGAVWINRWALRSRAVSTWVSLAGPLSNLALGILLTIAVIVIPMPVGLLIGLSYLALLQVLTFVLNILPVPGLDGYGAIEPYLSPEAREFGAKARPWAPLILFALLFAVPPVADVFFNISYAVFDLIGGEKYPAQLGAITFQFWR
ncbi:site-2 protease family protein [Amycolatopsis anabasis]|uniref:site-2 protease family protein n=1 Tax=Amycolatopsis anabasis TaxID=1840409 RepID=UPI00131E8801|nr:site-2 protease family protein [Amycolatopsis anabasis]